MISKQLFRSITAERMYLQVPDWNIKFSVTNTPEYSMEVELIMVKTSHRFIILLLQKPKNS